jgi:hypothetical protein
LIVAFELLSWYCSILILEFHDRVEFPEGLVCIFGGKAPAYFHFSPVSVLLPGIEFILCFRHWRLRQRTLWLRPPGSAILSRSGGPSNAVNLREKDVNYKEENRAGNGRGDKKKNL